MRKKRCNLFGTYSNELFDFTQHFIYNPHFPLPLQIPKTLLKKPSPKSAPEISVAHPGASYNPSLDEYQELLQNCAATELKKEKEEEKIARKLAVPDGVELATEVGINK